MFAVVNGGESAGEFHALNEGLPGGDGVTEFRDVRDDEDTEVLEFAESVTELFKSGDNFRWCGGELRRDAFEVKGFDEGVLSTADRFTGVGDHAVN